MFRFIRKKLCHWGFHKWKPCRTWWPYYEHARRVYFIGKRCEWCHIVKHRYTRQEMKEEYEKRIKHYDN